MSKQVDTPKENICEERPPIEWYEKELNDTRKEINRLDFENRQLKDAIVYLTLKIKEKDDTLLWLNNGGD